MDGDGKTIWLCDAAVRTSASDGGTPPGDSGVASPIVSLNLPPAVLSNSDCVARLASDFGVVVKLLPDHEGGNPFVVNVSACYEEGLKATMLRLSWPLLPRRLR